MSDSETYRAYEYIGTITADATDAENQATTATPFTMGAGNAFLVQPDAACHIRLMETEVGLVTAGTGIEMAADERFSLEVGARLKYLSVLGAAGAVNLKVFQAHDV